MKNKKRREAGQSLIEFALVLPILLLLLIGMLNFGEVLTAASMVQQVARDTARYASVGNDQGASETYATGELQNNSFLELVKCGGGSSCSPTPSVSVVDVTKPSATTWAQGDTLKVTVDYSIELWGPIVPSLIGNPYTVQASVTMMAEGPKVS